MMKEIEQRLEEVSQIAMAIKRERQEQVKTLGIWLQLDRMKCEGETFWGMSKAWKTGRPIGVGPRT